MKAYGDWMEYKIIDGAWFFRMLDTHGMPADIALQECKERQWIPYWPEFIREAIKQGWSDHTIQRKFEDMK